MISKIDKTKYFNLLKAVGSMSSLYSKNKSPLIYYRFVENLFAKASILKANLITREDKSFDCLLENEIGVGIKTFVSATNTKKEKIAQFNSVSDKLKKYERNPEELFLNVAKFRNKRIMSDVKDYGVNLNKSFYHCLVRKPGAVYVHEEPYELIDISKLKLIDNTTKYPFFSDGRSEYNFDYSNSTLSKRFKLNEHHNSKPVNIKIISEDKIYEALLSFYKNLKNDFFIKDMQEAFEFLNFDDDFNDQLFADELNKEYVILPLYGTKSKNVKKVESSSGINAWNAAGRKRKFGECYIPIPAKVHDIKPNFFPPRDVKFKTKLPNGKIINTKVSSGTIGREKAFQSDPLTSLGEWVHEMIDLSKDNFYKRMKKFNIYTYDDLITIGKDSVQIIKVENKNYDYELNTMPLDTYENFINKFEQ